MDATVPAEVVLGRHRLELIQHQLIFSRGDTKAGVRCTVPQGSDATAQRAVALHDIVKLRVEFEQDSTAVTGTLVCDPCGHVAAQQLFNGPAGP